MGRYYRSFNCMCWPAPGPDLGDLSHTLTYGEPTKEQLLVCASVINAYQALIRSNTTRRADIIRELRLGPNGPEPVKWEAPFNGRCGASRDGECGKSWCPQLRDNEPNNSGRHCPLDGGE
ncbi:hypothetical protein [Paraburkholderia tropica]|uniref:hypothetical protein n=1 Tax=Paraburkholderia tropica TaxID=92647 RepID=UPI003D27200B